MSEILLQRIFLIFFSFMNCENCILLFNHSIYTYYLRTQKSYKRNTFASLIAFFHDESMFFYFRTCLFSKALTSSIILFDK